MIVRALRNRAPAITTTTSRTTSSRSVGLLIRATLSGALLLLLHLSLQGGETDWNDNVLHSVVANGDSLRHGTATTTRAWAAEAATAAHHLHADFISARHELLDLE